MRAIVIHGAGDVRVEAVPDPVIRRSTDAVVRVVRACICGSDLWPYGSMPYSNAGGRIGHEFLGVIEDVGSQVEGLARGDLHVQPGRVFDSAVGLDGVPDGYRAAADRKALKVLITP